MEWVETTAKTVEAAKELALDQLHVTEDDAEFEVLETPKPGLFGRMRGEARVRARVRPVQPRPKVDRRERRRTTRKPRGRADADASSSPSNGDADASPEADEPETSPVDDGSRGRRRPSNRRSDRNQSPTSTRRADAPPTTEEPTVTDDVTVEEQATIIQGFVEGLTEAFGFDHAVVSVETVDDETMEVTVAGDDLGLLVGPRGATLQAIHELSRTVVQRQATGTHHGRVRLDIAGYRERRREALERFTRKLADEAIASGSAQVLEPMSAADRKVVHDTVNDIDGVHTVSEGEDARRHVVIIPDLDA